MKSFKEHCMDIISNTYSGNADSARTSINEVLNLKATEYMNEMKQDLAEGILKENDSNELFSESRYPVKHDNGKIDKRYEINKEYQGRKEPYHVVRFADKYLDSFDNEKDAHEFARQHSVNRMKHDINSVNKYWDDVEAKKKNRTNEDYESLDEGKVDPYTAHEILKQTGGVDKDHYALKQHELETRLELAKKHGYTPRGDSPLGRSKQYRVTLHLQRQAAKLQNEDYESLDEGKEANPNKVRELVLHADNDGHLYHSSTVPIQKNLERKFKKGSYDHEKAKTLWKYHADRAADSYAKQFGSAGQKGHQLFSPADRHAAAKEFADAHHEEMKAGNFQI